MIVKTGNGRFKGPYIMIRKKEHLSLFHKAIIFLNFVLKDRKEWRAKNEIQSEIPW